MNEDDIYKNLQLGISFQKSGEFDKAKSTYQLILDWDSSHPHANHNMGIIESYHGDLSKAKVLFENAIRSNPIIKQFWLSLIDLLVKMQRIDDANKFIESNIFGLQNEHIQELRNYLIEKTKIAKLQNQNSQALNEELKKLGRLFNDGQISKALKKTLVACEIYKNSSRLMNLSGACYASLNDHNNAIKRYQEAIRINPNMSEAYNNLGNAFKALGNFDDAIKNYEKAITIKPELGYAYFNLGNSYAELSDLNKAVDYFVSAFNINPDDNSMYAIMCFALKNIVLNGNWEFSESITKIFPILITILRGNTSVPPKDIALLAISLVKKIPSVITLIQNFRDDKFNTNDGIKILSEIPLFIELLRAFPIPDLEIEEILIRFRQEILSNPQILNNSPVILDFVYSLTFQCFANEYAYPETPTETKLVLILEDNIKNELKLGNTPSSYKVLCLASYRHLGHYDWSNLLEFEHCFCALKKTMLDDYLTEKRISKSIPKFGSIKNSVSNSVKAQYEESPYPRWINPGLNFEPLSVSQFVSKLKLNVKTQNLEGIDAPAILIAGCGTGKHSIGTARRFKNSKVTAIDLSKTSLSYAIRKSKEIEVNNIKYLQGDILDLKKLDTQFNLIESVGVLHHMEDPFLGWEMLSNLLNDGGLIKIGLYSELARKFITKTRQEISIESIEPTIKNIRRYREAIKNSKEPHHKKLFYAPDFYNLSSFRDLVFHIQEQCFTIPTINSYLDQLGLVFCGFENKHLVASFEKYFGSSEYNFNLDKWHHFEQKHPYVFSSMYQFWCQKVR